MKSLRFVLLIIILISCTSPASYAKGINLCAGADLIDSSGYINDEEQDIFVIDGNIDTKWCATINNIKDSAETREVFKLGYLHWAVIDLGEPKYFDSYKLYHASNCLRDLGHYEYNAVAWALQISDDGENWTTVNEFSDNYDETTEVYIGTRRAQYVRLMISQPEASGGTTLRMPEFELYECSAGETAKGMISELRSGDEETNETAAGTENGEDIVIEGYVPDAAGDLTQSETGTQITGAHIAGIIITAIASLAVSVFAFYGKNIKKTAIK
jgi:hypothetical protein